MSCFTQRKAKGVLFHENKMVLPQLLSTKSIIPAGIYAGSRLDDSRFRNVKTYQALIDILDNDLPLDGSELNYLITRKSVRQRPQKKLFTFSFPPLRGVGVI